MKRSIVICWPRHRLEIIDNLFEDLEEITPDDGDGITNLLGTIGTTGTAATSVLSTENSARSGRNSANTTSLSNLKTTLAATRAKQEAAADRLYRNSEQGVWNAYLIGVQTANTTYLGSIKTSENTYKTASDAAEQTFDTSTITAYSTFNAEACRLTGLYYDAINLAQNGSGITSTFFSDGSSSIDFEVCFVAGTPILLADGTSKSIEEIQSGDMVLAVDHEHPNSTPKPCRVTRVFHNAPQATWKLTLADGQTIQCTKEHPFYVVGRGWTSTEDLFIGDHLIRPDGSTISLSTKEYVETVQPVFNIEVENAHTYFVGKTIETAVLVHNVCPICGGSGAIYKYEEYSDAWMFFENIGNFGGHLEFGEFNRVPCICTEIYFSPENFARTYITNKNKFFNVFDNWGFLNGVEKDIVYAMGCVGISIVSLDVTSSNTIPKLPHLRSDAHLTLSYDEARNFYLKFRNQGLSPALLMMVNKGDIQINPQNSFPWLYRNDEKISVIIPVGSYDYRILVNIDIGNGNQACWLHAVSGWKDAKDIDKEMVIVTPVIHGLAKEDRKAVFIVIPNTGRPGLQYQLNFEIPEISESLLPDPFSFILPPAQNP